MASAYSSSSVPEGARICIVTPEYPPHWGGMGISAQRIASALAQSGMAVTVFTQPRPGRPFRPDPVVEDDVLVYTMPEHPILAKLRIEEIHHQRPFDLFHCLPLTMAPLCVDIAAFGNRAVVASIRGLDGVEFNRWTKPALRGATWITSVSKAALTRAMAYVDISRKSSFIANGIESTGIVAWQPTPENCGVIGTIATFRPKKNIPLLVGAYSQLPGNLRRRLLLVGDCPDRNPKNTEARVAIEMAITELDLDSEVTITGYIDHSQVTGCLSAMSVFVLSSDHEGMPNSILEAASAGVPVVATSVDGVKDILTSEYDSLLVSPGDCEGMAASIRRLLQDPGLALRLSRNVRRTAAKLTVKAEQEAYKSLYDKLLNSPKSHS